jgi:hypothetical protein
LHAIGADFHRAVSFGLWRASTYVPVLGFTTVMVHCSAVTGLYSILKFWIAFEALG